MVAATSTGDMASEDGDIGYDRNAKVIVIGGSGRVGGSTVRALRELGGPNLELVVGGRSERNFNKSVEVRQTARVCSPTLLTAHADYDTTVLYRTGQHLRGY